MRREKLVALVKKILKTEADLDFLSALASKELETLIACIRDRIEQEKERHLFPASRPESRFPCSSLGAPW
jgi:hypothetical protein